ncbi:hypothetical protein HPC49_34390 [Pyxidicoccus fallax]|uniref:ADYC domain-containing protein n=1 Tax=Pyxidicoccus fallax TaxID=394095 RepID=A0A848LQX0_9BACT|nr:ADYC domain-containing protein [Pyxidicoccus fallax]NMO19864.1 hypothetical protein [Pyxidicoccus fallax]NPC83298.1 hypothetical protein [Pyxidicoccus fallax]
MKNGLGQRGAVALVAILVSLMGSAAHAGTSGTDAGTPDPSGLATHCPGGTNCPGQENGPGIYVSESGSSCLWLDDVGPLRFCPESFENTPPRAGGVSSVRLKGRLWTGAEATELLSDPILVRTEGGQKGSLLKVDPSAVANTSRLGFTYQLSGAATPALALGSTLPKLTLLITVNAAATAYSLELTFTEVAIAGAPFPEKPDTQLKLYRYQAWYNNPRQHLSGHYCSEPNDAKATLKDKTPLALSVLPGHQVNGATGVIKASANSVTVACVSGAIVSCMENWNYLPWNATLKAAGNPTLFLGACIQGKRAAYFAHSKVKPHQNFFSYTTEGTEVLIRDNVLNFANVGVNQGNIEAIWDVEGAVCFNPINQRQPIFALKDWNPQAQLLLPTCTAADIQLHRIITGKVP